MMDRRRSETCRSDF